MNRGERTASQERIDNDIVIQYKSTDGNPSFPYHRHDGCEIYLFLSGNVRFFIERTGFTPKPGMLIIMNPQEMHRVEGSDSSHYQRLTINLRREYMTRLSVSGYDLSRSFFKRPTGENNIRLLSQDEQKQFTALCDEIAVFERTDKRPLALARRDAWATLLLLYVNELFQGNLNAVDNVLPESLGDKMLHIEQHPQDPLSLPKLASRAGINPVYLSNQFKRYTGLSVRDYHIDRKIARAKLLLEEGKNVSEACFEAGFNDYANFIRPFKARTGSTPGAYRKAVPSHPTGG